MTKPSTILFLDDHRGIYIPKNFADQIADGALSGVKDEDIEILKAGPDHEWYWESWEIVLNNGKVTDKTTGTVYSVYQDGACWLIPVGMEWSDKEEWFYWAEDNPDNACDECGSIIPPDGGDSIVNRHHDESCSLYDAGNE